MRSPDAIGPFARLTHALAIAGGGIALMMAALVVTSVSTRFITNHAINGDFEIVQIGLALAVFAFLPLCVAKRGNVMVDAFTQRLPKRLQAALDALWDGAYAAFAAFLAWRLAAGAADAFASRTSSMVLALPIGYAIAACAVMAVVLAMTCLLSAAARLRRQA